MAEPDTTRDRVLETIRAFPGIHFRGIVGHLGTSTALARYHLQALLEAKLIRASEVGGYVRYFPVGMEKPLTPKERAALQVLRQPRPLEIVLSLLELGPMAHGDLLEVVGGAKGALTYHLDKLVEAGIVRRVRAGEDRGFHLVDAEWTRDLLSRFEPVPEDPVHKLWEDIFRGHRDRKE